MKRPEGTFHHCPKCGRVAEILWRDETKRWFLETIWTCPHCSQSCNNQMLDEANQEEKLAEAEK
jgi:predicted RNA-binding Zn-ribbon protein involved in translation (DUF1610 family)